MNIELSDAERLKIQLLVYDRLREIKDKNIQMHQRDLADYERIYYKMLIEMRGTKYGIGKGYDLSSSTLQY